MFSISKLEIMQSSRNLVEFISILSNHEAFTRSSQSIDILIHASKINLTIPMLRLLLPKYKNANLLENH